MSVPKAPQEGQPEILNRPAKKKPRLQTRTFLNAYAQSGTITAAAKAAGVSRMTHYRRLKSDSKYQQECSAVEEDIGQQIEDACVVRAIYGDKRVAFWRDKPLKHNGRLVYEVEWDTQLQLGMLKRFKPAQYRERTSIEHSGSIDLVERLQSARARLLAIKRDDNAG